MFYWSWWICSRRCYAYFESTFNFLTGWTCYCLCWLVRITIHPCSYTRNAKILFVDSYWTDSRLSFVYSKWNGLFLKAEPYKNILRVEAFLITVDYKLNQSRKHFTIWKVTEWEGNKAVFPAIIRLWRGSVHTSYLLCWLPNFVQEYILYVASRLCSLTLVVGEVVPHINKLPVATPTPTLPWFIIRSRKQRQVEVRNEMMGKWKGRGERERERE